VSQVAVDQERLDEAPTPDETAAEQPEQRTGSHPA
jgi:hypothetical protein